MWFNSFASRLPADSLPAYALTPLDKITESTYQEAIIWEVSKKTKSNDDHNCHFQAVLDARMGVFSSLGRFPMKSTTAHEVGQTVRLALRSWGNTIRLVTMVVAVVGLFIASRRLPLITW